MRSVLFLCLFSAPALAQCPPGGCPAPLGGALPPPIVVKVEWFTLTDQPGKIGLYLNGTYAGALDPFEGTYTTRAGRTENIREFTFRNNPPRRTGETAPGGRSATTTPTPKAGLCDCQDCPAGCKCGCNMKPAEKGGRDNGPKPLFGVDRDRIGNQDRFTVSGNEASRAEAMSALEAAGDIPDDAGKFRFTVIGSAAARKPVLEDLKNAPDLAYWRDQFVVKEYAPDHWRIKDGGFKTPAGAADAVVYVQKPDGTVLWRQDTYTGPIDMARALRDKVPGYDPNKDPQPQPPGPLPVPGPILPDSGGTNYWWLAVIVAPILVILYRRFGA